MSVEDNSHAGQGAVLLDIGGDIGALVVTMPARLEGTEIEIRPTRQPGAHRDDHPHHPHVAVLARPAAGRSVHSAVFPELTAGNYELYQRPVGPVLLNVTIRGGHITHATWPP